MLIKKENKEIKYVSRTTLSSKVRWPTEGSWLVMARCKTTRAIKTEPTIPSLRSNLSVPKRYVNIIINARNKMGRKASKIPSIAGRISSTEKT